MALSAGPDVRAELRRVAGGRPLPDPPAGWLSWYHYGPWIGRSDVLDNSARVLEPDLAGGGYRVIQVDDGWQNAYGDWEPNSKFAHLKELCAELAGRGQVPGVWTAPFLVGAASDLAGSAPESWFVRDPASGLRAVDHLHTVFGPMHVLDARRREVRDHLERVFAQLRGYGFRYFKIDFLYAGAYAGIGALRAGIRAIRRGAGEDAYILACGAPLLPMRGLVEGCRIGQDTCTPLFDFESGEPLPTYFGEEILSVARNVAARAHLDGWFQLDPDVALAGGNSDLEQARQLVTAVALSGGPYFLSDNLTTLAPERLALLTNPEVAALAAAEPAVGDWDPHPRDHPPRIWRRPDGVTAVFNWTAQPVASEVDVDGAERLRDVWSGEAVDCPRGRVSLAVPANGVRLVRPDQG